MYNIYIYTQLYIPNLPVFIPYHFFQAFHCYVLMEKKKSKPIDWFVCPRSETLSLEYSPSVDSCLHLVQNIECAT